MSQIPGDIEVRRGMRIFITSGGYPTHSAITKGPYFVLDDFYVYQEFTRFLDTANIKYISIVHLKELVSKHRDQFISWLVHQLYLDIEPKRILTLDFRLQLEYREEDSI